MMFCSKINVGRSKLLKKSLETRVSSSIFSYYHISNIVFDIIRKPVYLSLNWYHICNGYEIMESTYTTAGFDRESEMKSCKALCTGYIIVGSRWRMKTIGISLLATLMNCKISYLTFTHIQLHMRYHCKDNWTGFLMIPIVMLKIQYQVI